MTSTDSVGVNLFEVQNLIESHSEETDLLCFPENSLYFNFENPINKERLLRLNSPELLRLAEVVKENGVAVHLGALPLLKDDRVFNTALLILSSGRIIDLYDKLHLFDTDVGAQPVRESDSYTAGSRLGLFEYKGWKVGTAVCYDLRFPELFAEYARLGADVMLVPAAFLVKTGRAHWELLLRARAVENQIFVCGAAQLGVHKSSQEILSGVSRRTWGQSLVSSPWGDVLASEKSFDDLSATDSEATVLKVELCKDEIDSLREKMPVRNHKRWVPESPFEVQTERLSERL